MNIHCFYRSSFVLVPSFKDFKQVLRFPAALISKEVNTYSAFSAFSVHLLCRAGNSQSSMWLLATVQLPFTKLCVVLQHCTVHLSGMEEEETRGEERRRRRRRGGEEDETGGGGGGGEGGERKEGGPRRQMPPQWPWHRWILIVQSHIVPTLLEM